MNVGSFQSSVSPKMHNTVKDQLLAIEMDHDVMVLFAVESGSRAWGFPSPDSDYDVRFVYAHPVDWYLTIHPGRDVIELPIDNELDISGWDLRKALGLMMKPNPVLLEWLSSPIRYVWDEEKCKRLRRLASRIPHRTACLHHYLSQARLHWDKHVGDGNKVKLKGYFYCLRPALTIRWIRLHPETLPPMNVHDAIAQLDLPAATEIDIAGLIELKASAAEVGEGDRLPTIDTLIKEETTWAETTDKPRERAGLYDQADTLFREIIEQVGNG